MAVFHRRYTYCFVLLILGSLVCPSPLPATVPKMPPPEADTFPVYPSIRANVDFWISIFTRYDKTNGVIHDTRDLSRVYGSVSLDPSPTRAAAKKNQKLKEDAVKQYKSILIELSLGKKPRDKIGKKVAALFGDQATPKDFKRAAHRLRIQCGLKEEFRKGLIRSGALVPPFKEVFRNHGLPEDLVYLPCVESSFNVHAYSKFGAAGVWQFTRHTGKLFMDIGYEVDQRRDPFTSTEAAARLLKRNFGELKSWPLAITAYNHGLYGMKRAKEKHASYPEILQNYQSRSFKFASQNFYSEFLAARHVAKNYQDYFPGTRLAAPKSYTRFTLQNFLSLKDLSTALGLSADRICQLNPALRPPVIDGRKYIPRGFVLRLPAAISEKRVGKALASHYRIKQKPSKFHQVRQGDTASSIARTHGISLRDLIAANSLDRQATIYIGQTLRLPGNASQEETIMAAAVPVKTAAPIPPTPGPDQKGTSLPETPLPGTPARSLPDPVQKGIAADLNILRQKTSTGQTVGIIRVAPEETLGHYADWLGVPTRKLRALNRMDYGHPITIGQTIKIPLPQNGSDRFEQQRYEFHQELLEDFFSSFFIAGTDTYEVKSGDTLWQVCSDELEIPLWLLRQYNPGVNLVALAPGQKLTFPLVSPMRSRGGR